MKLEIAHEHEIAALGEPVAGLIGALRKMLAPLPAGRGPAALWVREASGDGTALGFLGRREREVIERLRAELIFNGWELVNEEELAEAILEAEVLTEGEWAGCVAEDELVDDTSLTDARRDGSEWEAVLLEDAEWEAAWVQRHVITEDDATEAAEAFEAVAVPSS